MTTQRKLQIAATLFTLLLCWSVISYRSSDLRTTGIAEAADAARGKRPPPHVQVVKPTRQDITRRVRMAAEVKAWRESMIYSMASGYASSQPLEVGTRVHPNGEGGAPSSLLTVAAPDLEASLITAGSRVSGADADIAAAGAAIAVAKGGVREAEVHVLQAEARKRQAHGAIKTAEAMVLKGEADARYRQTIYDRIAAVRERSPNLVAQDKVDEAEGNLAIAMADLEAAKIGVETAADNVLVADAGIEAARAQVNVAQVRVESAEAGAVGADAMKSVAQAKENEARTMRDMAMIPVPFAGVIAERYVELGNVVHDARSNSGAKALYRLVDDSKLRIRFFLSAPDVPAAKVGNRVLVIFDDFKDWKPIVAKISRIAGALDPDTRTMEVEVDIWNVAVDESNIQIDENQQGVGTDMGVMTISEPSSKEPGQLRADMFARVILDLEIHEQAMTLPVRCVKTKKRKSWVMAVDANNVVQKINIEIGVDDGTRIEILSGLKTDQRVISRGSGLVTAKETVVPKEISE